MFVIAPLFAGMTGTLILSCLQGHLGRAWADDAQSPTCAQIVVGDFVFLAGDATAPGAEELAAHIPECAKTDILCVPETKVWCDVVERVWTGKYDAFARYAIKKDTRFDRIKLKRFAAPLPEGYTLRRVDDELYGRGAYWLAYLYEHFADAGDFARRGLGFCVLDDGGQIVGSAYSYSVYNGGIEIDIGTAKEHRRKGLATACAAALILSCLDRGLYPSWDAANLESVALAEKLGYEFSHEYTTYALKLREG